MAVFWVVGGLGALLLLVSLVFGDLLDGVFDGLDLGGGFFSTEVIGAFLAAFGLVGGLLSGPVGASGLLAVGAGAGAGVALGAGALWFSRGLRRMPTDATPTQAAYQGLLGEVITSIPAAGFGEVVVRTHGHRLKLAAQSIEPVARGATVVVVEALSSTAVLVAETDL